MVSVIRDARIDPERVLLAVTARNQPPRAQGTGRSVAAAGGGARAAAPVDSAAAAAPVEPAPAAAPVEPTPASAPGGPAAGSVWAQSRSDSIGIDPAPDLRALEEALRERLEVERTELLERAQAEGFATGLQRGEASYAEQLDALGAVIESARSALQTGIAETEDVMVEIAFEAVCKILGDAMQQDEGVVAVVREILLGVRERERLVVRVSPTDHEILERHRARLLHGEDGQTVDLVADERVVLGGCMVETTGGTLDGRLETQLRRLVDTLGSARRMQGEAMP